jgi:hypothetical protein
LEDLEYLLERVSALDSDSNSPDHLVSVPENLPGLTPREEVHRDMYQYISVLRRVFYVEEAWTPAIEATEADAIVSASRLLARLGRSAPQIIDGELDWNSQYWLSTAKFPWSKPRDPNLSAANFVDISHAHVPASTKPFYVGLYTYTGIFGSQGMWREYIERAVPGTGFGRPWHIWKLQVSRGARVWEVDSASAWADLNTSYPLAADGLIYPNWLSIAADYDAVHLSARAVAAIQGIRVKSQMGVIAPSYWDVESTLWLHWKFDAVSEVAVIA